MIGVCEGCGDEELRDVRQGGSQDSADSDRTVSDAPVSSSSDECSPHLESSNDNDDKRKDEPSAKESISAPNSSRVTFQGLIKSQVTIGILTLVAAIAAVLALFPVFAPMFDDYLNTAPLTVADVRSSGIIIPGDLQDVERPPEVTSESSEIDEWRRSEGGAYADMVKFSFVVRSDVDEPSIITALRVEVVSRGAPLRGILFPPPGIGGDIVRRAVDVDLDEKPPRVTLGPGLQLPLKVSKVDPEVFDITARVEECYCLWRVQVDYVDPNGQSRTALVDNDGEPFAITSSQLAGDRVDFPDDSNEVWPN